MVSRFGDIPDVGGIFGCFLSFVDVASQGLRSVAEVLFRRVLRDASRGW